MTTTLSSAGEVVIPFEIRRRLGLPLGAVMDCNLDQGRIILTPLKEQTRATLVETDCYLALKAPQDAPLMTPALVNEILFE